MAHQLTVRYVLLLRGRLRRSISAAEERMSKFQSSSVKLLNRGTEAGVIVYCKSPAAVMSRVHSLLRFDSTDRVSVLVIDIVCLCLCAKGDGMGFRDRTRIRLRADDVRGPVASAADGVEGEVRGALVDPAGDALARRPRAAHDELAARMRVREHADVEALYLAVLQDVHLR